MAHATIENSKYWWLRQYGSVFHIIGQHHIPKSSHWGNNLVSLLPGSIGCLCKLVELNLSYDSTLKNLDHCKAFNYRVADVCCPLQIFSYPESAQVKGLYVSGKLPNLSILKHSENLDVTDWIGLTDIKAWMNSLLLEHFFGRLQWLISSDICCTEHSFSIGKS